MMNAGKETPTKRKGVYLLAFFLIPSLLCFVYYYFVVRKPLTSGNESIYVKLPFYGPKTLSGKDTVYFTVPPFSFRNQNGKTISEKDYEGMIYVADFFSCSDKSVSAKLSAQYFNLQKSLGFLKNFRLLSFTLHPEKDSVPVLKQYANDVHSDDKKWNLVTGDRKDIYGMAANGYFIETGDSLHLPGKIVLIDPDRHIRGYYDGTTVTDVNRLQDEVRVLYAEYRMKKRKKEQANHN